MAKSLEKVILHATATLDGKPVTWIVAVFNDLRQAKPFAAMLKMHYAAKNGDAVALMDPNAPVNKAGERATEVKFRASHAPYTPEVAGLDESDVLG